MRWAFWTIRTSYPNAFCFAVTPIQRADIETAAFQPLLDALTQIAKRYGFLVIDAHSESGIVKDFEAVGSTGRDLYDGLHPNARGQIKMARLLSAKIKSAVNY
jgi:lysophospholipase L1-like esterase